MRRPPDRHDVRAAWWTWFAIRDARNRLRAGAVRNVRLRTPPAVPASASRAMRLVLWLRRPSCLERSLVLQRWLLAQGVERDVVVGTNGSPGLDFTAHAWLEGEPLPDGRRYVEILRLAP